MTYEVQRVLIYTYPDEATAQRDREHWTHGDDAFWFGSMRSIIISERAIDVPDEKDWESLLAQETAIYDEDGMAVYPLELKRKEMTDD